MAEIVTDPEPDCLYTLHYRCWDACQDPDDPYGRKPTHQCYKLLRYPITKITAKRIYFQDGYDRKYFIDRASFDADGMAYHRGVRDQLHLTPPELPTRPKRKTISELRREMADAHPDRGGDREAFQAARATYLRAKAVAR